MDDFNEWWKAECKAERRRRWMLALAFGPVFLAALAALVIQTMAAWTTI